MRFLSPRHFYAGAALLFFSCLPSFANNLEIGAVSFENQTATTLDISFTISQSNTFDTINNAFSERVRDCAWIFIKFSVNGEAGPWNHCSISAVSAGDDPITSIQSVADNKGVFVFANANKSYWTSRNVKIRWTFTSDGLTQAQVLGNVRFRVFGIEMVYMLSNIFVYNAGGIGGNTYNNFGGGSQVTVSGNDVPAGCDTSWPNGYHAIYCAKYEVSQAQYVQFLNTVDPMMNGSYNVGTPYPNVRYFITRDSSRPVGDRYYVADGHGDLACSYICWRECEYYASWSGLRPMTEMEFERVARGCRGGGEANTNVYPWGNTVPTTGNSVETLAGLSNACPLYYASYQVSGNIGPVPVGHYLSGLNINGSAVSRTQQQTGASPYGIADLAGNLAEQVINCSWTTTPRNGNGTISPPASWPTAASGKGLRGGRMDQSCDRLRISDRNDIGVAGDDHNSSYGFRPVRTP